MSRKGKMLGLGLSALLFFGVVGPLITSATPTSALLKVDALSFEWTQTSDVDFSGGILENVEIVGAGEDASIKLSRIYDRLWSCSIGDVVASISISSDGNYIAAGGYEGGINLFSKDSGIPIWSYPRDMSTLSIKISEDGNYIAAGDYGRKVYLFSKESSTPLWIADVGGEVSSVAISADGRYIAAGDMRGGVYLFDRSSSTPLWSYAGSWVNEVVISADGEYIAAGGYGGVYMFSKYSGAPTWISDVDDIGSIAITADGASIVAGSFTGEVYFFNSSSATPQWSYKAGLYVNDIAISEGDSYFISGSYDWNVGEGRVHMFSTKSSAPLWTYSASNADVRSVAISADGKYAIAGDVETTEGEDGKIDGKVYLFSTDSNTPLWTYTVEGSPDIIGGVASLATSGDGAYIAAGGYDLNAHLFSLTNAPGAFTSPVHRAASLQVYWDTIDWDADVPEGAELKFQIAINDDGSTWDFVGPDGTSDTYYTTPDERIWSGHENKNYIRYKAYFSTIDPEIVPVLEKVTITYNNYPEVELFALADGTYTDDNTPMLSWMGEDADGDNMTYQLQVATDNSFSSPVIDENGLSGQGGGAMVAYVAGDVVEYETNELPDGKYYWRARANDGALNGSWSEVWTFAVYVKFKILSASFEPERFKPQRENTTLYYELSKDAKVTIKILDNANNVVRTLVKSKLRSAGLNSEIWDGRADNGEIVARGRYRAKLLGRTYENEKARAVARVFVK